MITAEQFNKLVTKDDIKAIHDQMATKEDIDKILAILDVMSKKLSTHV